MATTSEDPKAATMLEEFPSSIVPLALYLEIATGALKDALAAPKTEDSDAIIKKEQCNYVWMMEGEMLRQDRDLVDKLDHARLQAREILAHVMRMEGRWRMGNRTKEDEDFLQEFLLSVDSFNYDNAVRANREAILVVRRNQRALMTMGLSKGIDVIWESLIQRSQIHISEEYIHLGVLMDTAVDKVKELVRDKQN